MVAADIGVWVIFEIQHFITLQQNLPIFPESETKFFYKVVDAQIEFLKSENGDFDMMTLFQGGRETKGKKKSPSDWKLVFNLKEHKVFSSGQVIILDLYNVC